MVRGLAMLNKKLLGSVSSLPQDDNFENVTLLLNGDGTNGAQNNTFVDSSTNNFTITRNGNTTQGSFSPYGNLWSNYFDGSGAYISAASNSAFNLGTGEFTIEGWIYITSLGGSNQYEMIVGRQNYANNTGWGIWIDYDNSNKLGFWTNAGGNKISGNTPPLNTWQHFAVVRNSSNVVTLYQDGVATASASLSSFTDSSTNLNIGGNDSSNWNATYAVSGYISNIRVVKGTAVYTSSFTPPTSPLTAVTNTSLLTCQSNRFIDNSSNAFAITVNGNPSVQRFSQFNPTAPYSTSVIGGSGYFDGSGDYLSLTGATAIGSSNYTLEYWVYPTSTETLQGVFVTTVNAATGVLRTGIYNGKVYVDIYDGTGSIDSGSAVPLNAWSHIAITKSGSSYTSYLNGAVNTTWTDSTTLTGTAWVTGRLQSDGYDFKGYVSNLRLVVGSVVYTAAFTPPSAPITAITDTKLLQNMTNAGIPDLAMQNNLQTIGNAQVSTSVKKYGTGSLAFDGTGDYLQIVNNNVFDTNGTFTLECWMYQSSSGDACFIGRGGGNASWSASNGHQFLLFISEGTLYWMWNTGGGSNTSISTSAPASGQWHHLAVGYNGTTTRFWLNGASLGTSTTGYTMPTTRNIIRVGLNPSDQSPLNGYIDDLRFTKGVDRYGVGNSTITPPASALPTF
jgi:hypothetical protein